MLIRMYSSPPLLIDTTSLLRARLDGYPYTPGEHSRRVVESLIVFERILLDGPSIERNMEFLPWLSDIEDGIEILDITSDNQSALYKSAAVLPRQIRPSRDIRNFMHMHMPPELGLEIQYFPPSTTWEYLQWRMESEDLKQLQIVLTRVLGENVPYSGAAFVAIARSLYYLCLQESLGSSLLLDPLKGLEAPVPSRMRNAGHILDLFDSEVREAFIERKSRWLGEAHRSLRLPLLANYIHRKAERHGWSIGRVILSMRQSREVDLFRKGLTELQAAIDSNDAFTLDAIFAELDAAAEAWAKRLGVTRGQGSEDEISVSVSLPFVGVSKALPLPRFRRRSTSDNLLVFVSQLLSAA